MAQGNSNPIHADPVTLAQLRSLLDTYDTIEITAHARSLGLRPPDDRPEWYVVLEYAPDGTEQGLFWVGPDDD